MASIIIVDDHPFVRLGVRASLNGDPDLNIVGEADDGSRGWALIQTMHPDLVIIDIDLPGIDGYELIKRVRRLARPIKVLVLSMHTGALPLKRSMSAGAHGYIYKCCEPGQVRQGCLAILAGYRFFPDEVGYHLASESDWLAALSDRELAVARRLVDGGCNKEVARALFISHKTVSAHKRNVFRKLGITNLVQLADHLRHVDSFGVGTGTAGLASPRARTGLDGDSSGQ
ncbi:response regulator transcription factor [Chitinasiproducens palmae]|uniref:response regulator transcription factor n=1 Tax=Chitinasiproducens palmae TaxID=1770053 RepID=UPI00147DB0FF|nr:response regulator transcription factor [Chitinasiproducens palmae]